MKDIISKIDKNKIGSKEIQKVNRVLKEGLLSQADGGPMVKKFQSAFSRYFKKKFAFTTNSGTSALHAIVSVLNLKEGDEVIVPALTNIADASVLLQEKIRPVFVDIQKDTFCISPNSIVEKITKRTRAIIVVHLYGQPVDLKEILEITKKYNLILIEDCAQAAGAGYKGKLVGTFGDLSSFSFYQTKNVTCGEGGMILTSNPKYARTLDSILSSGLKKDSAEEYNYNRVGYNYRLTEIQAAIGIEQFKKMERFNRKRKRNAQIYRKNLEELGIIFQKESENTENVYFYLTGLLPGRLTSLRDKFVQKIKERGIPVKKLYPLPLHKLDLFREKINYFCPNAEDITQRLFNLYVNPELTKKDIQCFSKEIAKIYTSLIK